MKSVKYLDALMKKHGFKQDKELAALLGVTPSAISQYRTGKRVMDEEQCLRVAQALGMENPMPIIAAAGMDRAEKTGQRSLWEVFTKAIQTASSPLGIAIILSFVVTSFVTPAPAEAAPLLKGQCRTIGIMSTIALASWGKLRRQSRA